MSDNDNSSKQPTPRLPSNFNALTFSAPCPSCGAPVEFASAGSVMAVCEYCQTTVIREGDDLKAQGKQSLTIEDYSPLQVGSVGRFNDSEFVLIGRIQYRYDQGVWNEWYLQFADGRNGWLSEALGQYSLTFDGVQTSLPAYSDLAINDIVEFKDIAYRVTDRRSAQAIAGEGELPYVVGKGWETWTIDAQFMRRFISLDYSDSGEDGAPIVYAGQAVELDTLDMQLLKDDRQIKEQAGSGLGGAGGLSSNGSQASTSKSIVVSKIECPNCGSPIPYIEGKTDFLICPSCHTESKLEGNTAEMLEMHSAMQHFNSTLPLGAKARINDSDLQNVRAFSTSGEDSKTPLSINQSASQPSSMAYHDYVVIGVMRLAEVGEMAVWTEYLLYSLSDGFLWLSEESAGWFVSRVLSEMPQVAGNSLVYDGREWRMIGGGSYQNKVFFAIGAFNWQVKVNDRNTLVDYANGEDVITSEQTSREITYTISAPLPPSKLKEWFGGYLAEDEPLNQHASSESGSLLTVLKWHGIIQVLLLIFTGGSIIVAFIVAILIFIAYFKASNDYEVPVTQYDSTGVRSVAYVLITIGLILSLLIGLASSSSTGATSSRGGGGFILLPGGSSDNSGRGGFSSGGSHK